MLNHSGHAHVQLPLIITEDKDDIILLNTEGAQWFKHLYNLQWENYRDFGAEYYDALYHFNKSKALASQNNCSSDESKQGATQLLLFDRPTIDKSAPVIFEAEHEVPFVCTVSPSAIAPGITPDRLGGKKPKCFFALFKSFLGVNLMGFAPDPQNVHSLLESNLSFARVCGFIPKGDDENYWHKYVPGLRKIEQFDQIMTDYGIWERIKLYEVKKNITDGVIKKEEEMVGDTTHYHAISSFETISYKDENGVEKKKSQSKITKNCRCANQETCPHPWEFADDGAGTIVKGNNKMYWGHKASIIGLPKQGIPLDAIAISDAATHDGETFYPHAANLFKDLPEVENWFERALYDSACDCQELKKKFKEEFGIELKTSINPRRNKTITNNLSKDMQKLTPRGNLVCNAGFDMVYQGKRNKNEKYIFIAPEDEYQISVCLNCPNKVTCCPNADKGRTVEISYEILPHIDPQDPPMAKRFKAIMKRRPSVERMIKRLKCDLSDDRLKKRSNKSFQAYLHKTMIAFHILLRS